MPNWCHNKLRVSGPAEVLNRFKEDVRLPAQRVENEARAVALKAGAQGSAEELDRAFGPPQVEQPEVPLSFEKVLPTPEGGDWYSWRLENWGTKWDASFDGPMAAIAAAEADVEASVERLGAQDDAVASPTEEPGAESILYRFDTAGSPPASAVKALAARYPELTFALEYGEPGLGFAGRLTARGEAANDEELPIDAVLGPDDMWF